MLRKIVIIAIGLLWQASLPAGQGAAEAVPSSGTSNPAYERLEAQLKKVAGKLGDYPHARLDLSSRKKQTTRMLKCVCKECGYVARTTQKWLESTGAPLCACNEEQMDVELKD